MSRVAIERPARNAASARAAGVDGAVRRALTRGGRPLERETRAPLERQFGYDFSRVRVHTDSGAAQSARAVSARAYTVGQEIVFGEGEFDPGAEKGRALLAHELAHTVQQPALSAGAAREADAIRVEPPGTSLEQAAQARTTSSSGGRSGTLAPIGRVALQRQPTPQQEADPEAGGESLFTVFVADEAKKTDRRFARREARADAARIRKAGTLSTDEKQLVAAKLRFFEGDAWQTYSDTIRPALIEVTREEIQMDPADAAGAPTVEPKPTRQPGETFERLKMYRGLPEYIDNNITEVNYFGAELAIVHYKDGSKIELGLVPKWMKYPVVEVDYLTPAEKIRGLEDASGRLGYMNELELEQAPRTMPYSELVKTYAHFVDFYLDTQTVHVIPSRINMLTAPTLCRVLRDSLRRNEEQVQMGVQIALGGIKAVGFYAGAGGIPKGPGVAATSMFAGRAARAALTPTGRKLAAEMDSLLASGATKTLEAEGVVFADVALKRKGSELAVSRFMSKAAAPGQGTGYRMALEFENAAAEIGRLTGAKTVTVDVGIIINPGWRAILESRGYVHIVSEGKWVKTIKLE